MGFRVLGFCHYQPEEEVPWATNRRAGQASHRLSFGLHKSSEAYMKEKVLGTLPRVFASDMPQALFAIARQDEQLLNYTPLLLSL